jgi:hypothetical protein
MSGEPANISPKNIERFLARRHRCKFKPGREQRGRPAAIDTLDLAAARTPPASFTACKGAASQHPSWTSEHIGLQPFPV